MNAMNRFKKIYNYYNWGGRFLTDLYHIEVEKLTKQEMYKTPFRYEIINFLIAKLDRETTYLEIGVRNPDDNYNKINSAVKYSVDPGIEFKENPVDFKVTSDAFFEGLRNGNYLDTNTRFDVIFIDGLHLAEQVDRDIENALEFLKEDGFIILHDCNPPSEWHARESHTYEISPAGQQWNGTTWKAFLKARYRTDIFSCCVDTDWGVGVISKKIRLAPSPRTTNSFYEFNTLNKNRKDQLGLTDFESLQSIF